MTKLYMCPKLDTCTSKYCSLCGGDWKQCVHNKPIKKPKGVTLAKSKTIVAWAKVFEDGSHIVGHTREWVRNTHKYSKGKIIKLTGTVEG